jgi:hypothetical protein
MSRHAFRLTGFLAITVAAFAAAPAHAEIIYGMTALDGTSSEPGIGLVRFDSATPGSVTNIGSFSGVVAGQGVRSIDFRPLNGQLYAISTDGAAAAQLYTVNLVTAALTPVGSGFSLGTNASAIVEMDFNPVLDAVRVVTGATGASGQTTNFRVSPITGALLGSDTSLAYSGTDVQAGVTSFSIIGAAYSNNVAGASTTTLYAWDFTTDSLVTIGGPNGSPSPSTGTMFTVNKPATADLTQNAGLGMDISGATGLLYATHDDTATAGATSGLYTRDLTTGVQTFVGDYPAGTFINDISVLPIPEPTTLALTSIAAAGLAYVRRKRTAS